MEATQFARGDLVVRVEGIGQSWVPKGARGIVEAIDEETPGRYIVSWAFPVANDEGAFGIGAARRVNSSGSKMVKLAEATPEQKNSVEVAKLPEDDGRGAELEAALGALVEQLNERKPTIT